MFIGSGVSALFMNPLAPITFTYTCVFLTLHVHVYF